MMIVVMMMMVAPVMMRTQISMIPFSPALIVAVDPMMMMQVPGNPHIMPAPVPEFRSLVIWAIPDFNRKAESLRTLRSQRSHSH